MTKRDIVNEVLTGLKEVGDFERGQKTLRTRRVEPSPLPEVTGAQIREIRERLNVSRSAFAHQLRVSKRTLENWEQGRAKPNDQAKVLLLLVARHPDTLERLQAI